MKTKFSTVTFLAVALSLLTVFTARADEASMGRFNSYVVSQLTNFRLAPSLEGFAPDQGQVAVDLDRSQALLSLDSQRGRFEVTLPIVSRERDVCNVVTYRGTDGATTLEIRDYSRTTCIRANVGFKRLVLTQAYLTTVDEHGVAAISAFEGAALLSQK